jgi:hypothetical protein
MALSTSLTQKFRKNQLLLGSGWRVAFAPFNIAYNAGQNDSTKGPAILDLAQQGPFNTNSLPAGWTDLGWISGVKATPQSKVGTIKAGYRGATRELVRGEVGEQFEFQFREFTRMAFKIATGTEIFNLLKTNAGPSAGPLNASGSVTVPMGASGYQANGAGALAGQPVIFLPAGSGASFAANDLIVCDVDYDKTTTGYVGSAGIPIFVNNAPQDTDFIRKTSDFVARVASVVQNVAGVAGNQDALVLGEPLVGGGSSGTSLQGPTAPPAGSKVQKMVGWTAREGGTFVTEWSALFVLDTIDGDQFAQYYPHVAISQFKGESTWAIPNIGTTDLTGYQLDTQLETMAFEDPLDGETIVCYRSFYPQAGQNIAI